MDIHFLFFIPLVWACTKIMDAIFGFIFTVIWPNAAAAKLLAGVQPTG